MSVKKFTLEQVRAALVKSDILPEGKCAAMSDEELKSSRLFEDLGADSLSSILFLQHLEAESHLIIPDEEEWNAETVGDLLKVECY